VPEEPGAEPAGKVVGDRSVRSATIAMTACPSESRVNSDSTLPRSPSSALPNVERPNSATLSMLMTRPTHEDGSQNLTRVEPSDMVYR
jgi:hypothetical protein